MNIEELLKLSKWITSEARSVVSQYELVYGILQHNSSHPQQKPLEEDLSKLKKSLRGMSLHTLSMSQIRMLENLGALSYLGKNGVNFLKKVESKTGIDSATATQDVSKAKHALDEAIRRSERIMEAFSGIKIEGLEDTKIEDGIALLRVEFKDDASITNIVEWKAWASTWHDIARGITMSVGDAPESVQVLGASKGSIIIELGVALTVAKIITSIVNEIIGTTLKLTELQSSREDLRKKRLINDQIEKGIESQINSITEKSVEHIKEKTLQCIKKNKDGEKESALHKAISKLLDFHKKGGEVDCIPPESEDDSEGSEEIESLRSAVENLRIAQKELKLITHQEKDDD